MRENAMQDALKTMYRNEISHSENFICWVLGSRLTFLLRSLNTVILLSWNTYNSHVSDHL
jgi:hypothetical protein